MASQTANLGLTKPAYTDPADVGVLNGNFDLIDTKVGAIPTGSNSMSEAVSKVTGSVAPDYSDLTFPIASGTRCTHEGKYYSAKQNIQTSESWTSGHWDEVTVDEVIGDLNTVVQGKQDAPSVAGEAGQVLGLDSNLDPVWTDGGASDEDKAPVIIDYASGAIATFPDGADDLPIEDMTVQIEPVQDLHGQSNPYPAGGGDQKYNPALWSYIESRRFWGTNVSSLVEALNALTAGTYTLVAKIKVDTVDSVDGQREYGFYTEGVTINGEVTKDKQSAGTIISIAKTFTITAAQVGTFTKCYWYAGRSNTTTEYSTIYDVGINVGSVTSLIPYSNICPISGWTGATVTHTGKNLFDKSTISVGKFVRAGNTSESSPLGSETNTPIWNCSDYIHVLPNTKYTVKVPYFAKATAAGLVFFTGKTVESAISGVQTSMQGSATYTFTTPANCNYLRFSWSSQNGNDCQLESGSTASTYEEYRGQTYPITFDSAGTVYGGMLNPVTGELIVTDAEIASYNGETLPSTWISDRDVYAEGTTPTIGAQVVYKLAEPLEYDLSDLPAIATLLGSNAIWADTGDVSVDYRADTKLFISNKGTTDYARLTGKPSINNVELVGSKSLSDLGIQNVEVVRLT